MLSEMFVGTDPCQFLTGRQVDLKTFQQRSTNEVLKKVFEQNSLWPLMKANCYFFPFFFKILCWPKGSSFKYKEIIDHFCTEY